MKTYKLNSDHPQSVRSCCTEKMAQLFWRAFRPNQEYSEEHIDEFIGRLTHEMVRKRFPQKIDVLNFREQNPDIIMSVAALKKLGPLYGGPGREKPSNFGRPGRGYRS